MLLSSSMVLAKLMKRLLHKSHSKRLRLMTHQETKGRREGETCILSTSLESKADMPNLLHSAFSYCCAMVVRGTNLEVVEPWVK